MRLFDTAYLKLTAWYVAIIMIISLLFSTWVYNQTREELQFGLNRAAQLGPFFDPGGGAWRSVVDDRLEDSRHRLLIRLVGFNAVVLAVGAAGSYWLARRTMQPIADALDAQRRFTADASHELRTPLAAMKTEIEVGLRDKKLSKDEAMALLHSNLEEVDRLGGLAESLLALTRVDVAIELTPVVLAEVTDAVVKRLRPLAEAKRIAVKTHLEPATVQGDAVALDKIIGILLDNAIKYSPQATKIVLRTYEKDGHGYVEVQDHGIGIAADGLPRIFDRFYRADTSRSAGYVSGYGLGLSIAQTLAANLDGTITVDSALGEGSTFTLSLAAA